MANENADDIVIATTHEEKHRWRIHRSTTEKYSARFFNYLIWWVRVRVLVVVRVWVRVTVGPRVMVGVGLVRG